MDDDKPLIPRQRSPDAPKTGTPGSQRPGKFARHFEDVQFPASKMDILEKARSTAAPGEVLRAIERLPGTRFESMEDVLVAYESAGHDLESGGRQQ